MKRWVIGAGGLFFLLIAAYIIAGIVIRKKIASALHTLPAGLNITYSTLHLHLLTASMTIDDLNIRWAPSPDTSRAQRVFINRFSIAGIRYFALLHQRLAAGSVRLEGCTVNVDEDLLKKVDSSPSMQLPFSALSIGRVECAGGACGDQ